MWSIHSRHCRVSFTSKPEEGFEVGRYRHGVIVDEDLFLGIRGVAPRVGEDLEGGGISGVGG